MGYLIQRVRFSLDHRWAPKHMSGYLDVELNPRPRRRMENHVRECEACRQLLADLRTMLAQLQGLRAPGASVNAARMAESVRLRLRNLRGSR
jgi:anti-sigma factor RsiW